ncbi:SDR family NAD(P)-dependent oxidoreductase [Pseudorhodoferax sp. Leaf274]|uniref:SDR family NAD(P)-dependent oxidoreductase n=1 Tax=Pseudorhodoferax sp. Leaf274 TaxID=1736318 RepID=UPI0007034127|nr:glucose 1-dehydrogenase [Pseudorhodoferax sp. Leaf274]KQP38939.1 3-oxoacyl-ACP reductase [Pseudorhodoferax sp. Leaf274]
MLLHRQLALVTGAARGMGASMAQGLAAAGADVVVTDLDAQGAQRTAAAIRRAGGTAHALALDVTDPAQCAAVADATGAWGGLSILVNNAGVRPRHAFDSADRDLQWRRAMDVNLDGVRHMTLACLAALSANRGSVINITSITAFQASPMSLAYSTSKAAAAMLTKVLALELAPRGVRVNAIAPGVIATEMTAAARQDPARSQYLMGRIPMGRYGQPGDLVGPAVFLASSMSSYMTGAVLNVDGGYLAA